jgi:SpoVK/Ycf46/Vps4 family AAA+-type ATPase
MSEHGSSHINQNRNVLMQELDRFNGVVVCATNLFQNYDEALVRRIAAHIPVNLPNKEMRVSIFKLHIPVAADAATTRLSNVDFDALAESSLGLSGGDILNVCFNAMVASSVDPNPDNWRLTQEILLAEIVKVKTAKEAQRGRKASADKVRVKIPDTSSAPPLPVVSTATSQLAVDIVDSSELSPTTL